MQLLSSEGNTSHIPEATVIDDVAIAPALGDAHPQETSSSD